VIETVAVRDEDLVSLDEILPGTNGVPVSVIEVVVVENSRRDALAENVGTGGLGVEESVVLGVRESLELTKEDRLPLTVTLLEIEADGVPVQVPL